MTNITPSHDEIHENSKIIYSGLLKIHSGHVCFILFKNYKVFLPPKCMKLILISSNSIMQVGTYQLKLKNTLICIWSVVRREKRDMTIF